MTQARETNAVAVIDPAADPDPVLCAPPSPEADERTALRLTVPLLLAAGWGALLTFSLVFLLEDGRGSGAAPERVASAAASEPAGGPRPARPEANREPERVISLVSPAQAASAETAPAASGPVRVANAAPEAVPASAIPRAEATSGATSGERPDYVGTWGPNAAACGAHSRRRGFLPATITEDGAKAGRTECRFRNGRRDGVAWAMAAECSERGRRWTSQVRLVVDGDRLTWTSGKGPAFYVRCGRRDG